MTSCLHSSVARRRPLSPTPPLDEDVLVLDTGVAPGGVVRRGPEHVDKDPASLSPVARQGQDGLCSGKRAVDQPQFAPPIVAVAVPHAAVEAAHNLNLLAGRTLDVAVGALAHGAHLLDFGIWANVNKFIRIKSAGNVWADLSLIHLSQKGASQSSLLW
jgi:hypothetical protein